LAATGLDTPYSSVALTTEALLMEGVRQANAAPMPTLLARSKWAMLLCGS